MRVRRRAETVDGVTADRTPRGGAADLTVRDDAAANAAARDDAGSAPRRDPLREAVAARILDGLGQGGRRLADLAELMERARFARHERTTVLAALSDLVRTGAVAEQRPGRYALAASLRLRAGRVQVHPDGYAFLVSEAPAARGDRDARGAEAPAVRRGRGARGAEVPAARGRPGARAEDLEDLYISGAGLRPAMHGDRVLAAVLRRQRGREVRSEGRVVEVLERRTTRLLGVYRRGRTGAYLLPQDPRLPYHVMLTDLGGATDGDMVVAAITRYPGAYEDIEARVEVVLGPASDPRVETDAVVVKHDLPRDFPEAVRREAERVPREVHRNAVLEAAPGPRRATAPEQRLETAATPVPVAAPLPVAALLPVAATLPEPARARRPWHESPALATRLDLRALPLVTIDGENARDFDDAVAVLDGPAGGTRLLVAIADVAAYVPRGSALDREARARGTSVYFPDRVIPMLPEELSNGICSLNPDVDRLVRAVLLDCDRHGQVLGAAFFPGVIRSRARLTYTEVRQIVADGDLATRRRHAPLVDDLERMAALAEELGRVRHRRGSIDFDLPEAEIILDLRGRPENIVKAERNVAHRMIESFMLAANEAVAHYLTARRVPMPYRIHEPPDEDALQDLARFLAGFGARLPIAGEVRPAAFQRALEHVAGRPEERLVHTVLLRSMKQARYAPANAGHFGLAADCYTHFTSPIRRYPDLVLHRVLAAHLAGNRQEIAAIAGELGPICDESSRRERVAMDAEREVVQLKKVQFMQDKIGETYAGFISGVVPFGFFVELERYFVEGLVHVATLTDDRYEFVEHRHLLEGRRRRRVFRLGDPVTVRVASVSIERKQIDFVLADAGPPAARQHAP